MRTFVAFRLPQSIFYGRDSFSKVGSEASERGSKALIISDGIMDKLGVVKRCGDYLETAGIPYVQYVNVNSEPTDEYVDEALELLQQNRCDVVVAVGGGSCIDTAKAVAVLATNGGYIGDYMHGKRVVSHPPIPLIAIPTTAGTGSEVTDVTVITNSKQDIKMMIKDPAFLPAVAIVDPLLTLSSPKNVTAATGIDALCHAIEAYISRRAQPMTDTFALAAIEGIMNSLQDVYEDGSDIEAREKMSLAAMQAGAAFSNASVCLVHGMSRPIGALFHVPHGVSNAMLLPAVLEFSKESGRERLAYIARHLNPHWKDLSEAAAVDKFVMQIKRLCSQLEIPNLKNWGIKESEFSAVITKMAEDAIASGSPGNNPRIPTREEIKELYKVCYDYNFAH